MDDRFLGAMLDNRYEILEKIGTGGMAVVYKARCHRLNRLVAIKILKDELAGDEDFRRRFHTESQAVAMLSHPNIMAVYDVSKTGNVDYIVMELLEGITLKQYINRKGLLSWKESLHFAMQICKAIMHAHSKGVIHRDIKPQNIMILKDGSIKVADFGIARLISTQSTLTQESLGSVHYISPEQAKGGHVDARTDIYSLGVVLYEMLTSQLPFVGDSPVSVAIQHISAIPLMPRDINPDIPNGIEDITMHAMEPALNKRYTTADEMLRDLEEFRKNPAATFEYIMPKLKSDPISDDTRPVPTSGVAKAAGAKPQRVHDAAPVRKPQRRSADLSRDEYRSYNKRARSNSILLGTGIVIVLIVIAFMFMWNNFFKDMIAPDNEFTTLPSFIGYSYEDIVKNAEYNRAYRFVVAEERNFSDLHGEDVVYEQNPPAHQRILVTDEKTTVTLYLSLGMRPMPYMPSLVGEDYRTANNAITKINNDNPDLRLNLSVTLQTAASDSVTKDLIIETFPAAGEALSRNLVVYVTYSTGPDITLVEVPDLRGMRLSDAEKLLNRLNLTVGEIKYFEDDAAVDLVIFNTERGDMVPEKTAIEIQVSSGPRETPTPEPSPEPSPDPTPEPGTTPDVTITPEIIVTPPPSATPVIEYPESTPPDDE